MSPYITYTSTSEYGKEYKILVVNPLEWNDKLIQQIIDESIEGIRFAGALKNGIPMSIDNIDFLKSVNSLRYIGLNDYPYRSLSVLKYLDNLEQIVGGNCEDIIPLSYLKKLELLFIPYNKKSCEELNKCTNLKYLSLSNYKVKNSDLLINLNNLEMLQLRNTNLTEISAISNMNKLNRIEIEYDTKMISINWLLKSNRIRTIGFKNCKNISNWHIIGELKSLETIIIENCGEIASLDFVKYLPNIKRIQIIGSTTIKDGKLREILTSIPTLNSFFIPICKKYDITLQDEVLFNENKSDKIEKH